MTDFIASLIQRNCTASRKDNLSATIEDIKKAAKDGAKLIILSELHTSLYFCQQEDRDFFTLAETIPGPTTKELSQHARDLGIVIITSLFEKRGAGLYHNTAVVIDNDGIIAGIYRKMHIPDDPGYYEKYYFTPGDLGFNPVNTSLGKIGLMVCWDQWFPEAARLMALAGAEILVYPTAIGWDPNDSNDEKQKQLDAWLTIQRSHAIANSIPLICCNRYGFEADPSDNTEGIQFWGNSFICGPQGEYLATAPDNENAIIATEIDLSLNEKIRQQWPFLRDRRIDYYDELTRRFRN